VAHQVADVVEVIGPALAAVEARLFTDGGAMRSGLLAATVADLTGMTLLVSHHGDEAALGAAHLAGLTVGVWSSIEELAALPRSTTEVPAELPATDRRTRRQRWAAAVPRSRGWQGG
jgi:glycerol kinase